MEAKLQSITFHSKLHYIDEVAFGESSFEIDLSGVTNLYTIDDVCFYHFRFPSSKDVQLQNNLN